MNETQIVAGFEDALARASAHAPFLRMQLERFPLIASRLAAGDLEAALAAARAEGDGEDGPASLRSPWRSATSPARCRSSG